MLDGFVALVRRWRSDDEDVEWGISLDSSVTETVGSIVAVDVAVVGSVSSSWFRVIFPNVDVSRDAVLWSKKSARRASQAPPQRC